MRAPILGIDLRHIHSAVTPVDLASMASQTTQAYERLQNKGCPGSNMLGWLDLPLTMESMVEDIQQTANAIRRRDQAFVVIGIGGSYLGARSVIESLQYSVHTQKSLAIVYAGHHLSTPEIQHLLSWLENRDFSVNVISKSGTTTEPAVLFRVMRGLLTKKYGPEEGMKRVIATTDANQGTLRDLARQFGFKTYPIADDVGGRYSVLTPVGLLPIAVAGINIGELLQGARDLRSQCLKMPFSSNPVLQYAAGRYLLYQKGKLVEVFSNFHPHLHYLSEWLKQLFGESEGKKSKCVFPAGCDFTTDLHSMGQYIQEGSRVLFETFIVVDKIEAVLTVPVDPQNADGLNFLAGTARRHLR